MITLRKLWNKLTKLNSGKSRVKNYDMAEALVDMIEEMAQEKATKGYSESLLLIFDRVQKRADQIKKELEKA